VGVFHLPETRFDLGLGAVGRDDIGGGPVIAVGEQDPFAEQLLFQSVAGTCVGAEGQAQLRGGLPGQGGGDYLADPARLADRGDLGFDRGVVGAGVAAGQGGLQVDEFPAGFGQGLVEPA